MKKIGFIGVGIMGKPMVRNLMKAGFELHIYARSPEKIQDVAAEGAIVHESIAACAKASEAVITMLSAPVDVEEVYTKEGNLFDSANPGAYLIDMTTSAPSLAETLYAEGKKRGFHMVDAPVTGGDYGAKAGTLSILVGGDREDFEACMPLFQAMGKTISYFGKAGCGQHAKMANQILVAGTMAGICESLSYAKTKGLDLQAVLDALSGGAAGGRQLSSSGPKILNEDYAPGFYIRHFVKDMKLAENEACSSGLNLEVLHQVLQEYSKLMDEGKQYLGTQALVQYYLKPNNE